MKLLCLLLALLCGLVFTGCHEAAAPPPAQSETSEYEPVTPDTLPALSLAYSQDDTLDPFAAKTEVNLYLAGLLYDSLTVITGDMTPALSLAASADSPDPTHLAVTLRPDAVFSDGTPVQPKDVLASFRRAKESPNYKELLSRLTAAEADKKTGRITFTLAGPDPNGTACLSFPIVKDGTFTDQKGKAPIGGGAYVFTQADAAVRLTANPRYEPAPHFETVGLRHLPNSAARHHALVSGDISFYFDDLNSGENPRVTGAGKAVDMNALLFLGVNNYHKELQKPLVRRALSLLLDRQALVSTVYLERGYASQLPFHPHWKPMRELEAPTTVRDLDGGIKALEEAGCKAGKGGTRLTLELLYSTGSQDKGQAVRLIQNQLEGGGITVRPVPLPYEEYLARLEDGKFDLYLGEIRLGANHSLSPLLAGGAAGYGALWGSPVSAAYEQYLNGEGDLQAFTSVFAAELPYIPVCWRSGYAAYDRRLTTVTPTGYTPYYGLPGWN